MPKMIDLEPHEYRRKGFRRFIPHPLDGPTYTVWGIGCGIWAGVVIGVSRYFIEGDSPYVVAAIALGPAVVWGIALLFADREHR